jgi:hypothetical protein
MAANESGQYKSKLFRSTSQSTPYKSKLFAGSSRENIEPKERTGWSGVGSDIADIFKSIPSAIGKIPSEYEGLKQQAVNEPSRIGKNLLAGVGEGAIGLLNAPHDIIKELQKNKITPEWLNKYNELPFTHIPEDLGVEKAMGLGEQKPGDTATKLIAQLLSAKKLSPSLAKKEAKLANAENTVNLIDEAHANILGQGKEHGAHAADTFLNELEGPVNPETGRREGGRRQEIGNQFNEIDKDFEGKTAVVPNVIPKEQINALKTIAEKNGYLGEAPNAITLNSFKKQAEEYLQKGKPNKEVSAQDLYRKFRTLTMQATEDKANAFAHGIDPEASYKWRGIAAAKQAEAERLQGILEKVDPNAFEKLKVAKSRWAKEYAPLRENPLYNEMVKHEQTSKNIMKFLNGKTKGNKILNEIVEANPELQKTLVGQQYAKKPSNLTNPSELIDKFAKMSPEIARLIKEQKEVKYLKERRIPEIEESIKIARAKKEARKNKFKGALGATAIGAGGVAAENLLDRNVKDDLSILKDLFLLKRSHKK